MTLIYALIVIAIFLKIILIHAIFVNKLILIVNMTRSKRKHPSDNPEPNKRFVTRSANLNQQIPLKQLKRKHVQKYNTIEELQQQKKQKKILPETITKEKFNELKADILKEELNKRKIGCPTYSQIEILLNQVIETLNYKFQNYSNQFEFKPIWQQFDPKRRFQKSDGYKRLESLRDFLARFDDFPGGIKRSKHQRIFHDAMIESCGGDIFGEEFNANAIKIKKSQGWTDMRKEMLIAVFRRFGKTYATAMFAAAYILSQPHVVICIFSPAQRQSKMLMALVQKFVFQLLHPRQPKTFVKNNNQEELKITPTDDPTDERVIQALPASTKTLRGIGGNVMIIDEAGFVEEELYTKIIFPVLSVKHTALICLSTLDGEDNYYSQMLTKLDPITKKTFYKTFFIHRACDACREAGTGYDCDHNTDVIPPWQSSERHKKIRQMMEGNREEYEAEMMGMMTTSKIRAFPQKYIDKFFSQNNVVFNELLPTAFIAIDPSGAGDKSDTAICSGVRFKNNDFVLIGIEKITWGQIKDKDMTIYTNAVSFHLERLRTITGLKLAKLVLFVENNMGSEVLWIKKYLVDQGMSRSIEIYSSGSSGGRDGVHTSPTVKENLYSQMKFYLQREKLFIHKDVFSTHVETNKTKETITDILKHLKTQMENFAVVIDDKKNNLFALPRKTFTGKANGKDDLVLALQLLLYWSKHYVVNSNNPADEISRSQLEFFKNNDI